MNRVLPILLNTEMVQAILEGRKTVTRRVMKPQPLFYTGRKYIFDDKEVPKKWEDCDNIIRTYRYQPGDILYVRETWQYLFGMDGNEQIAENTGKYYYAATDILPSSGYVDSSGATHETVPWRPSIHMPKAAARIWLEVKDVGIERLQDIDDEGVVAEGLPIGAPYDELWDSTIKKADRGKYGWDANPWVWVIEFARCGKPESEG